MSILSMFKRIKKDKIELKEKSFIVSSDEDLSEERKLNIKEIDDFDLNEGIKLTDKELISKIINACPELIDVLDNKNKSYKFRLPAVNGKLLDAKKISKIEEVNIDNLVQNDASSLASQVASFIKKDVKRKKKALTADMVVASYEISSKYVLNEVKNSLDGINTNINHINTFLSSEYKSKIEEISLFLEKTITFTKELLENEDRRKEKISQIENHISNAIQLFKQAILVVTEAIKDIKDNYSKYEKAVYEINEWVLNLKSLYGLIRELCRIDYVFYQGSASFESCMYDLKKITPEINEALLGLANWHRIEQMKLDINLETQEHKNTGIKVILKKFVSKVEDHRSIEYSKIPDDVMELINNQMNLSISNVEINIDELFGNEINMAIVNGDIYYCKNNVIC